METYYCLCCRTDEMSDNINDCVLLNHTECQYSGLLKHEHKLFRWIIILFIMYETKPCVFRMDSQVAFFCGDSEECRTLGSEAALKTAKENIEKHYIMVGVLEHLEVSLVVMECLLPMYFKYFWINHQIFLIFGKYIFSTGILRA